MFFRINLCLSTLNWLNGFVGAISKSRPLRNFKRNLAMYIILVYDIEVKRVAKVCKYLRQHLNWIQNSVFEGQLTKAQLTRVKSGLAAITDSEKDSVIIYQLRDARWVNKEVMGVDKNPATNLL